MSKKTKKSKSRLSIKIILAVVISTIIAMTVVAAAAGSTYEVEIIDGKISKTVTTRIDDANKILEKNGFSVGSNDVVDTTEFSAGEDSILRIYRSCRVTVNYYGVEKTVTANGNVTDALKKAGIKLTRFDNVNFNLLETLSDNMYIMIQKGENVKITFNGETKIYNVPALTVKEALMSAGIELGEHDEVRPVLETKITKSTEIEVVKVTYKEKITTEKVSFKTVEKETNALDYGETEVKTEGADGEKKVVKREKYVNGKYESSQTVSETVTKKPVDEVILVGVKKEVVTESTTRVETTIQSIAKPVDGKPSQSNNSNLKTISNFTLPSKYSVNSSLVPTNYKKKLTGSATAYYGGYATSTGKKPQPGYIAVDPDIIPYGTEMWIVSNDGQYVYGYSIAADTGGFIYYGTTLADLYFNTYDECINFGRRDITIYIL